ncbi:LXG domain-containing protein [Cytobacillus firmus]|uniref:ribonuclease YeeF family protein n=1 Tax=Cytobacillus firmus TaxID=1399 RepID=UPI00384C88E1
MEIEENGIYNAELILLKVLKADSLLAGIAKTSNQLSILKDQVNQVQVSIQELVSLEEAFKGQGGQAIRAFYQDCHQPFLQFLESWIDEYQSYLKSFIGSLKVLESSPSGFIRQEFLEHELKQGLKNTLQITAELTEEANNIIKSVSDIVALPRLEDGRFIQATKSAEDSSRETVEKLEDFDQRETAALDPLLQDLSLMNQYIQKIAGMFQSGSLSLAQYQPKSLNWKDFHEEISNPNPESGQSILQEIAEGAIEGASNVVGDTWEGLKSTYELGRTIMGPFSPLFLGSELLFNRDQLLENQRKHQQFYLGIVNDPIGKVRQALDMPKYIWSAVSSAWEREIVNGDAKSRTAFFTYGLTSMGIGILGDKGIGKAGTIAKTVHQAGKGEKALPIYTPVQTPAVAGGGMAWELVPYNVLFDPLTKIKTVTDDVFGVKGIDNDKLSPSNYPNPDPPMSIPPVRYEPKTIEEVIRMRQGKGPTTKMTHGDKNIEAHHRQQVPVKNGGILDELEQRTHRGGGNHTRHDKPSQLTPSQRAKEIREHYKERGKEYILPGEGI